MIWLGILLVFIAFILLRFFFGFPRKVWVNINPNTRSLFFYFQQIIYWGLLIAGLILCFISSMKTGFVILGCFLFYYNLSINSMRWKRIPLLGNTIAKLLGIIILILGVILFFTVSLKFGIFILGTILLIFFILKLLLRIEKQIMKIKAENIKS